MSKPTVTEPGTAACVECGTIFTQLAPGRGRPRLVCSAKCRRRRTGSTYTPVVLQPIACEHCGETFAPKSKAAKFCCIPCSRAAHKLREVRWPHTCPGCGDTFLGRLQTYCTKACGARFNGRHHGGRPSADGAPPRRPSRPGVPTAQRSSYLHLLADPCSYCGGQAETVDHIEPASRGGADDWSNYTASCKSCNTSKMTSPLLAFLLRRRIDGEIAALRDEREVLLTL